VEDQVEERTDRVSAGDPLNGSAEIRLEIRSHAGLPLPIGRTMTEAPYSSKSLELEVTEWVTHQSRGNTITNE
jgi:hypothetical protein